MSALGPSFAQPVEIAPSRVRRVPATLPRIPLSTLEIEPADILAVEAIARGGHARSPRAPEPSIVLPLAARPRVLALLRFVAFVGVGVAIGVALGTVGLLAVRLLGHFA